MAPRKSTKSSKSSKSSQSEPEPRKSRRGRGRNALADEKTEDSLQSESALGKPKSGSRKAKERAREIINDNDIDDEVKPVVDAEKENAMPIINTKSLREALQDLPPPIAPPDLGSSNIIHRLYRHTTGQLFKHKFKQATLEPFVQQLSEFKVSHRASPFDRRVTAMEWHPTHPTMLAVGSKGGDLMLWDYEKGHDGWTVVQGIGPGGNIAALRFNRDDPTQIYSASLNGQVRLQNFEGKILHLYKNTMDWRLAMRCMLLIGKGGSVQALRHDLTDPSWIFTSSIDGMVSRLNFDSRPKRVYLNTNDWNYWYCSVDLNYLDNVLVAGDNIGNVVMMSREGKQLWSERLHKSKVTHCEFNKRCPWLLATASTDKCVKVWDIRNVSGKKSFLYQLNHDRPVNSAYFSPDGTKLLTTEQHHEVRVYAGPLWDRLERTIIHPHRFFQHITPIKATWHPFQNLIVVGRYPDGALTEFKHDLVKSIDAFDVDTGELVCRLVDQSATGIQSLNVFSPNGDALATGMGVNTLIWQNADILASLREEKREVMRRQGREPPEDDRPTKMAPKRRRGANNNQKLTEKLQTMKKVKSSR